MLQQQAQQPVIIKTKSTTNIIHSTGPRGQYGSLELSQPFDLGQSYDETAPKQKIRSTANVSLQQKLNPINSLIQLDRFQI